MKFKVSWSFKLFFCINWVWVLNGVLERILVFF